MFPEANHREDALADGELQRRITSSKRARLEVAKAPTDRNWNLGRMRSKDELVLAASQSAADFVAGGMNRVAIMVNRVRTAVHIAEQLAALEKGGLADIVLMTGRMRPFDRDLLVGRWHDRLRSRDPEAVERPVMVVTTQCLEVGADFSFDALVTECASLDALRQRFGRLDRLGDLYSNDTKSVPARILIRQSDRKRPTSKQERDGDVDPVYGGALPNTWHWLSEHASRTVIDFGITAMDALMAKHPESCRLLFAPAPDAPVMLPGHLDQLVQTAPRPAHQPDPAVFLHGPGRGRPEARLVFRSDLGGREELWSETIALLPPTSAESLTVPLSVLNRWLRGFSVASESDSDIEGQAEPNTPRMKEGQRKGEPHPFLVWRGRDRTRADGPGSSRIRDIRPGDLVIVAADREAAKRLAHYFQLPDGSSLDIADAAYRTARRQDVIRIHPTVFEPWKDEPAVGRMFAWAREESPRMQDLQETMANFAAREDLPEWLAGSAAAFAYAKHLRNWSQQPYPGSAGGNWILLGPRGRAAPEDDRFDDEDDARSESPVTIPLSRHCAAVGSLAAELVAACLGDRHVDEFENAGLYHDVGKADERFQALLSGSELAAAGLHEPIAKGPHMPQQRRHRARLRAATGLPDRFRHESVSLQLAELAAGGGLADNDLFLHLIASHHGYGRPFLPVCDDRDPPPIRISVGPGSEYSIDAAERMNLTPVHRLDSGSPERFWRLVRQFGWWGLAYLEALLRLADWEASSRGTIDLEDGEAA